MTTRPALLFAIGDTARRELHYERSWRIAGLEFWASLYSRATPRRHAQRRDKLTENPETAFCI